MLPTSFAQRLSRRQVLAFVLSGLATSLIVGLLGYAQLAPVKALDRAALDLLLRSTASGAPARATVAVDIDDASLSAVGQWPWPRYRLGSMIQRLAGDAPAAIALDILFAEPDRSSLASVQQTFKRDFGLDVTFSDVPAGLLDNDGYLGHEMAKADAVGARYFYFDHRSLTAEAPTPGLVIDGRTDLLALAEATAVLDNVPPVAQGTRLTGFVNSPTDDDGQLRRLPLLIRHEGRVHTSLALTAVMRAEGLTRATVEPSVHGLRLRVGRHAVPIDAEGHALLRFQGDPSRYPVVSAVDVLNGAHRASDFRGKLVFIGSSAVGLSDFRPTAVAARFPGLRIQAVMAENILQDHFVSVPSWAPLAVLASCLLAGAAMATLFVLGSGVLPMLAGSLVLAGGAVLASVGLYLPSGLVVSAVGPVLVVALLFVGFIVARFGIEKRRARVWLKQLENARQVTIESMASVAETRDPETGAHIKRTQNYVRAIAQELRRTNHYVATLTPDFIELLYISAPLHDIGKVGVPDHILLKPGRLTPAEMEQMKQHAEFGRQIIGNTAQRIDGDNFLTIAGDIAATHHEKWDGSGYPRGLVGQAIPLSGRIMAVADIYDALISRRCYKEPFPHAVAVKMMHDLRGSTFDPAVLDAFFRIEDEIQAIAARFRDEEAPPASDLASTTARLIDSLRSAKADPVAATDAGSIERVTSPR